MKNFTHLRMASGYSFKYGTAHANQLVERAAQFEMSALALTDIDTMAGAIRFTKSCEANGIAPILGINLSFVQKKYRITLLAQGGQLASLYRLVTEINSNSSDGLLTHGLLERFSNYSKNILILHGPESQLAAAIASRKNLEALSIFNATRDLFADQALECVSHLTRGDGPFSTSHAARMLGFARDHQLPAVLTNAVRMLDRSDGPVADVLDAARKLVPLSSKSVNRQNSEAYFKASSDMSYLSDEISRLAGERDGKSLLNITADWAQRTILSPRKDVGIGGIHLPDAQSLGAKSQSELAAQLRSRCEAGLSRKYVGAKSVIAASRLEEELSAIRTLGYESYFLTVADITDLSRAKGIRVAARGSGAGSLICHVLGISGVEPITHGLLMERFCSPLRGELPDIDIDVESARRLEIYDAIFEKYGQSCATVSMVETYRSRHAIRDVGAALGISPMEIDLIAKSMPHIRSSNISKALANLPELKNLNLNTPILKMAIELAGRLDSLPRHLSMHPCAIVLADQGLRDYAPQQINASGYSMLQFDKDDVEAIGLLKLDVLGVRMQSAISYTLSEIERLEGAPLDIDAIALDDKKTFDLIKSTRTLGIFQIESPGQRELVGKFAPETFNDLIIDISLFRPGPVKSDMITPFLATRHGLRVRPRIHDNLEDILCETEGVVVFHEQVIRIISVMTGISLAESDEKRRQLGDIANQETVCNWFYPAALARGYTAVVVEEVWEILHAFASFGFCKAHAAAFALPTYQSSWLKTHHTAAFLAGVLTHDPGMYPKRVILDEARQWGIKLAPINVNLSGATYLVEKTSDAARAPYLAPNVASSGQVLQLPDARGYAIRIALSDVDGIDSREVASIISGRPYLDLADFVYRSGASRPTTESLLIVGAFDDLHKLVTSNINRRDLLLHLQDLYRLAGSKSATSQAQMTFELQPPSLEPSGLPEITASEQVKNEIDILGMDVSTHLLEFYGEFLNAIGAVRSSDLIKHRSGTSVLVAGVKVALQTPPVRSGRRVMFLTVDDGFGCNDITFFEDKQADFASVLRNSWLFLVRGEIRRTGPRGISLLGTGAWELATSYEKWRTLAVYGASGS
ncbi:MAG: DNA polymerase III subunit alpha [Actinomycetes bacterium]